MPEHMDLKDLKFADGFLRETNPSFMYHFFSKKAYT